MKKHKTPLERRIIISKRVSEYKRARYESGNCEGCGKPRDSIRVLCETCRKRQSDYYRKRTQGWIKLGLCKHCGEPVAIGSRRYCLTHWFEKISCDRTGTTKNKDAIRKLIEEQNYLCVYTGKKLVLGENAQLDHKTPPRLGGSNDIENLQWIDAQVNLWKGMRTHEEFVKSCRQIADRFSDQHNLTDTK